MAPSGETGTVSSGELGGTPAAVELLRDPALHTGEPELREVELRETHISWLLFTDRLVYKVKKPVDFGFLDFTDPDQRRALCHEEVRLNRRLSPSVYRGVAAIVSGDAGPALMQDRGGEAPPGTLDYAVVMRRLPEDRWLSDLLARGEADRGLMHRIAHRLVGFHALAERDDEIRALGALETVRANVLENFEQTREFVDVALDAASYDRVEAYAEAFLEAHGERFRRREREGRICDGHGDLHADQICVENGIDFIDCIEFNRRFRCADVAADLAFPAMDLEFHNRPDLADALVLEYMARSGDTDLLGVLDFYRCYRAFTRGKVECLRARQTRAAVSPELNRAQRYFDLAARTARLRRPTLVVISGLMGSGKSTVAAALAPRLDAVVLSSDVERKRLAGLDPAAPVAVPWRSGIYTPEATDQLYRHLATAAAAQLRRGRHVIVDASCVERTQRSRIAAAARSVGARALFVVTVLSADEQRRRLARREAEGGSVSDGRNELADRQRLEYEPPDEVSEADRIVVSTDGPREEALQAALRGVYGRAVD